MKDRLKTFWKNWRFVIIMFGVTAIVSLFLVLFVRFPRVLGISMEPTYHEGDRVLMFNWNNVTYNDVVVLTVADEDYIIKRVVGLPGDELIIRRGGLYRNGGLVLEPYINESEWTNELKSDIIYVVPDDCIFVLGDNRNHSRDSRYYGMFDKSSIIGVVVPDLIFKS